MSTYLSTVKDFLRSRKRIICIIAPVLFGVLFMVLCIMQLRQSIWFDEAYSAYLTRFEYPKVWDLTAADVHPPLYYFVLKTWAHFFGHTDFAMRMLSVVCGAVAILFAYLWLKYKYGAKAAIIASFLLSISPVFVRYGQEMRMYTMVLAIVFAATYVLQLAIDSNKKRWWVIYAILIAMGMWTHYFSALAWIVHVIYLARIYKKKIFQKHIILTYVGAVLLFLPWVPSLLSQTKSVESGFWIGDVTAKTLMDYWSETLVYRASGSVLGWTLPLLLATSVIIIALSIKYHSKLKLILMMAFVPVLALVLLSMPPLKPMFIPRYLLYAIVSVSILSGIALAIYSRDLSKRASEKSIRRRFIATVLIFITLTSTSVCGLSSMYSLGNYNFDSNTKSVSRDLFDTIVALDGGNNYPIICESEWLYYDMSFYSSLKHPVYFMNEKMEYNMGSLYPLRDSAVGRIDNLDAFISKHDTFWYITTANKKGQPKTKFPRKSVNIVEYSTSKFNDYSDVYAIVKMSKE